MADFLSHSANETFEIGRDLGKKLAPHSVICLFGDLGAGKTTLVKGIVAGYLNTTGDEVNSPTFTYLNTYSSPQGTELPKTLYHFDLYRLHSGDEFLAMGFDELFHADGVCCIEWSERISTVLPVEAIEIEMHHLEGDKRRIVWRRKTE